MPTPPKTAPKATPKGKAGGGLNRKLGPLPVWGWGLVGVGGLLVYRYIQGKQAAAGAQGSGGSGSGGGGGSILPATAPTIISKLTGSSGGGGAANDAGGGIIHSAARFATAAGDFVGLGLSPRGVAHFGGLGGGVPSNAAHQHAGAIPDYGGQRTGSGGFLQ